MAGQCGIRTGLERQLWFVESRCGQSGIGAADKESCGSCGEVLHGTVSCGGHWYGRLGKFCCVELGQGSARTGKARFGRRGVFRFGKLRYGMFRQARNGMLSFVM